VRSTGIKLDGEKLWKYYDAMVVKKVSPPPEQMDARALTSYLALLDDIEEGLIREQAQQKPNVKKAWLHAGQCPRRGWRAAKGGKETGCGAEKVTRASRR
jgi:hypothetical protein